MKVIKEIGRRIKNPSIFPPCQIELIVFGSGELKVGICPSFNTANIQKNNEDTSNTKGKYIDKRRSLFFIFDLFRGLVHYLQIFEPKKSYNRQ